MREQFIWIIAGIVLAAYTPPTIAGEANPGEPVNELQAVLSVENPTVARGEPARFKLAVRNVSTRPFSVYRYFREGDQYGIASVKFSVRDANGMPVNAPSGLIMCGLPGPDSFLVLEPGALLERPVEMVTTWNEWDKDSNLQQRFLEPGRYEALVEFSQQR
ncbi:MAG: hypothetical protein Q8R91_02020, partial [Candidatus Omnitrophota bacterium]|nr:hypothetical protein [Candidatus Omnitrophota bacterium]